MTGLHFVKPSAWRAFWCVALATSMVYVAWVIALYVLALVTQGDSPSYSGERSGFLAWDLIFAAPIYALMFWYLSLPVVIVLGLLIASLRRRETPNR